MSNYYSENELPVMLTVQDVAVFLRISKNTAYNFVNSGINPSVKIGRQVRVYREDVIRYIKSPQT